MAKVALCIIVKGTDDEAPHLRRCYAKRTFVLRCAILQTWKQHPPVSGKIAQGRSLLLLGLTALIFRNTAANTGESTAPSGELVTRTGGLIKMATYRLGLGQKSMYSGWQNIDMSWKRLLAGNFRDTNRYTTRMVSGVIIGHKILSCGLGLSDLVKGQQMSSVRTAGRRT